MLCGNGHSLGFGTAQLIFPRLALGCAFGASRDVFVASRDISIGLDVVHASHVCWYQEPVLAEQEGTGLEAGKDVPVEAHCAGRQALQVVRAIHRGCSGLKDVQHCREDAAACLLCGSGLAL